MADQGGNNIEMREYRKGNWTVSETMVLIEAKKMDDERRLKKIGDNTEGRSKPTELRWKWVEDYCCRRGCLRSQNQCNDKWDNLMRDYKKVREYQRRIAEKGEGNNNNEVSYWEMEKNERKEKNLPSNMLRPIYEELEKVVEKKGGQRVLVASGGSAPNPNIPYVAERTVQTSLPPLLQHQLSAPIVALTLPAPTPQLPPPTAAPPPLVQPPPPIPYAQPLPHSSPDYDTSEHSDSAAKRRRRSSGGNGEGTSTGTGTATANISNEVGNAISKSASIIADAIQASEERKDRKHKDLVSLHERRLKIEESKTEISKNGFDGLVAAIDKLTNSILALASHQNQSAPK